MWWNTDQRLGDLLSAQAHGVKIGGVRGALRAAGGMAGNEDGFTKCFIHKA